MAGTGSRGAQRRGAGKPEGEVPAVLRATERPLTPARIRQEIDGGPAYDTVHTALERDDKGLVPRDADGRRGAYRTVRNAAEPTAQAMREAPWAWGRTRSARLGCP
ncbi:BlaI/MecI/CopY family transcriptional regulator [Streptomyces sp. NPDC012751]|uniref:BlaI/MecI/CopY family transcriptional regulator n=1 Tax=Streptomyces sp. NPDC012751 TaxID=3364846 RepID=UPI0036AF2435